MADRDNLESVRLDESAARRLIERATELDARLASESTVAELRDAARSAGISEEAFNRALTEVRHEAPLTNQVNSQSSRSVTRRRVVLAIAAALLIGAGALLLGRSVPAPIEQRARAAPLPVPRAGPTPTPTAPARKTASPTTKTTTPTKVPR